MEYGEVRNLISRGPLRGLSGNRPETAQTPDGQVDMPLIVTNVRCKWIVYGLDGFGGKLEGCTRMRPEVAPASAHSPHSGHAFRVTSWFHGIVRNLEGCAVPRRSIRA